MCGAAFASSVRGQSRRKPNIIVIFADDLGYGDVGCFGSSIPTPNLDRMAAEGMRLTRFYSASSVCSPSRAALLTGRYPARSGVVHVLMPDAEKGLSATERTAPKILREQGYRTACIGKWHLGPMKNFGPDQSGFDEYFGVPYSNDMLPLPLLKGQQVLESPTPQSSLLARLTAEAISFIERNRETPFFMYLSHTAPHIPLAPSPQFRGKSGRGAYGDVVMELDWSTGEVLSALKRCGIDEHTLVVFTSDNGPWYQGSAGRLQGRKGSTYEGGVREPFIARFPGQIPAGTVCQGLASTMDLLPTFAHLAGAAVSPHDVDGVDIWPMLSGAKPYLDREALLFFDGWQVQCVRWGPWKLHVARYNSYAWTQDPAGGRWNLPLPQPELYHIDEDPTESYDRAPEHPALVADLQGRMERVLQTLPDQVRSDWQDVQRRRVMATPVGALPRREDP